MRTTTFAVSRGQPSPLSFRAFAPEPSKASIDSSAASGSASALNYIRAAWATVVSAKIRTPPSESHRDRSPLHNPSQCDAPQPVGENDDLREPHQRQ